MISFDDYARHDALGLAGLVRHGEVSPRELLARVRARTRNFDRPGSPNELQVADLSMNRLTRQVSRTAQASQATPAGAHAAELMCDGGSGQWMGSWPG